MKNKFIYKFPILLLSILLVLASSTGAFAVDLIPMGETAGIRLKTNGVVVVGLTNVSKGDSTLSPAKDAGIQSGDIIVSINSDPISSGAELQSAIEKSGNDPVTIKIKRSGDEINLSVTPVSDNDSKPRIGILIRDSLLGIGTLTYVDPSTGKYGALGHGISDSGSDSLLPLSNGTIVESEIINVKPGTPGHPGELQGSFTENEIGTVEKNCSEGIFGDFSADNMIKNYRSIPIAASSEIAVGPAQILSNIDGKTVGAYDINIAEVYDKNASDNRNMLIEVTDKGLISITGGIVQGMSGSPIIQNGKLIGAVTHVLVNDPTRGYGIFIENMLEAEK